MRKCIVRFLSTKIFIGNTFLILFTMKISLVMFYFNSWENSCFLKDAVRSQTIFGN